MRQTWETLLFAHWPMPPEEMRERLPRGLTLDTYGGQAWLGIVPFRMTHVRPRGLPPIPTATTFPELNVRTYVTVDGKPGVYFFSLDAASWLAVRAARFGFHLPYFDARMKIGVADDKQIAYRSQRQHRRAPPCELVATYGPNGQVFEAAPGSLEDWLTARYCLYSVNRAGRIFRGEIHHAPWRLQVAEAAFERNTMASLQGFALPDVAPLLHYAHRMEMICWLVSPVD
jgi:uncharacterized protein YqjF (DUF2071 family)